MAVCRKCLIGAVQFGQPLSTCPLRVYDLHKGRRSLNFIGHHVILYFLCRNVHTFWDIFFTDQSVHMNIMATRTMATIKD